MPHPVPGLSRPPADGGVARWSRRPLRACTVVLVVLATASGRAPPSAAGVRPVLTLHATGAQIYECRADAAGILAWRFREPRATLMADGRTVGRHFAGPTWELADGSAVVGRLAAQAPGATAHDVALLRLDVASRRGRGELSAATVIQRLNTHGGGFAGPCGTPGAVHAEPYTADYVFSNPS